MSTFSGIVREIPNISVDRFDGINLMSTTYFLSHCHTDHMKGLFDQEFLSHLQEENVYLYCSEISYHILMNSVIKKVKQSVKILSFRMEAIIDVPPSDYYSMAQRITVTVIPAGHCPGSVMFLFDSTCGRILYTGDMRIVVGDVRKMKQFLDCDGSVKPIETMYLDTTFLNPSYKYFPPRKTSAIRLCQLIEDWISLSSEHFVHLITPAKHGSEYVFCEIFSNLNIKVHVNLEHFDLYQNVPEVESAITASAALTQIHACGLGGYACPSLIERKRKGLVREIKPSALWFHNREESSDIVWEKKGTGGFGIAYSSHSSLIELIDFVEFLKPKKVVPCVVPPRSNSQEVKLMLKNILTKNT